MDKEVYDALYKDIVCKSYCNIEVPSEVLELQNQGMGFVPALRQVMKRRIKEYAEGGDRIDAVHLKGILDDLDKGMHNSITNPNGSRYLARLEGRAKRDSGSEMPSDKTKRSAHMQLRGWTKNFDQEVELSGKSRSRYVADIIIAHLRKQQKTTNKILEEVNE